LETLKDRRLVVAAGMGLALIAGLVIAALMLLRPAQPAADTGAPTSGLVVETGRADDARLDPEHPLRCFVDGKSIGELPLRECAQKNGVATGALDVGLDSSGALAAAGQTTSEVTPLPPHDDANEGAAAVPDDAVPAPAPVTAVCWGYGDGGWTRVADAAALPACVAALYDGRCGAPGEVAYGRWGARTLRLVGRTVQVSDDNRNFRTLSVQAAACAGSTGQE
jgi:hypothetical protein